jgi:hypothetical protein
MTWVISADPATQTIKVDLSATGYFFGGPGPKSATVVLGNLGTEKIEGAASSFGKFSGTITSTGKLTFTVTGIATGLVKQIDATGTFTGGKTISISYTVEIPSLQLKAPGTVKLTKS